MVVGLGKLFHFSIKSLLISLSFDALCLLLCGVFHVFQSSLVVAYFSVFEEREEQKNVRHRGLESC